ncbi:hypothetical protein [Tsukamurella sputi]
MKLARARGLAIRVSSPYLPEVSTELTN